MIKVHLYDNKYTLCLPEGPGEILHALRHGEPWRDLVGDGLVLQLGWELHEAREKLEQIRIAFRKVTL